VVLGTVGTSGHESAEKPPGGLRSIWDSWDIRTHGTRKAELAERGKKLPKSCFAQFGTAGPKVHAGRGSA
ncbi:hypothetical protein KI387_044395, partial [Taxus chinensis]